MKIGYYVQGSADQAFVHGLADRWCPRAELAKGKFRGESRESFQREIFKALHDLRDNHHCDVLVVLTDSDAARWREVKRREWQRMPEDCHHMSVFGVADRNIECWLALDREALAHELGCSAEEIPNDDPSGFVKNRFEIDVRGEERDKAKKRIQRFVASAPMRTWIQESESFEDFYKDIRNLSARRQCRIPNELE